MYQPERPSQDRFIAARGLHHHVNVWDSDAAEGPAVVMLHGWMDVGASYQFVVDAMPRARRIFAPDLRGFGLTDSSGADCYWFPDYLGDLDALLDVLSPDAKVDLVGHSMGGNVVMQYASARPERIRKLVNLEGFGLPQTSPSDAPSRLSKWLDDLKQEQALAPYASLDLVARRLMRNNPRLAADKAAWLAGKWSREVDGHFEILGDSAHKRVNPMLYRVDEALAHFSSLQMPVLWVEAAQTQVELFWRGRYSKAEFHRRLDVVPQLERKVLDGCGHMLHHDQPEQLAALLTAFLD